MSHISTMPFGGDLIKVDSTGYLDSQRLIQKLINSGDFKSVMLEIELTKMSYNDPLFVEQYHLQNYTGANLYGQNYVEMRNKVVNNLGRNIIIGIGDTGYAPHEDINDPIGTGGYDFVQSSNENGILAEPEVMDNDPSDSALLADGVSYCHDGHGLSVAGLIAAKKNNGLGVAGAMDSESVDLVYARVLDCFGNGGSSSILKAVAWMSGETVEGVPDIEQRVDIINLSLGGFSSTGCGSYEQKVYDKARENGVVIFVAAGNSNTQASTFVPAACNNVITVGATTDNGDKASFSNFGENIDIMAAGDSVMMLASDTFKSRPSLYFAGSGTSMASPNAAAGGANLLLTYPNLTPDQVESLMISNGRGVLETSICGQLGCGSGAVDMGSLMDAIPNIVTETSYVKKHRYEGYNTPEQKLWLEKMDNYTNTCNMIKYTWGEIGTNLTGVSYKMYMSENAGDFTYTETVNNPQKIYNHTDNTVIGVEVCQDNTCGDLI
jgi:serine protease